MAIEDFIADYCLRIKNAMAKADKGAFLPVRERNLFQLGPLSMVLLELDPAHQDLLFPDLSLEDPDLKSIMGDGVSERVWQGTNGFRYSSSVNCEEEWTLCERLL